MGINYKKAWADPIGNALIKTKLFAMLSVISLTITFLIVFYLPFDKLIYCIPIPAFLTTMALYYKGIANALLKAEGKNQHI